MVDNLEEASEAFAEGASDPLPQHLASLSRGLCCCHGRLKQKCHLNARLIAEYILNRQKAERVEICQQN